MAKFATVQVDIEPTEKTKELIRSIVREELSNIFQALRRDIYGSHDDKPAEQKPEVHNSPVQSPGVIHDDQGRWLADE